MLFTYGIVRDLQTLPCSSIHLDKFTCNTQEAELPASSAPSVASPHAPLELNARQSMKAWRFEQPNLILDIQHGVGFFTNYTCPSLCLCRQATLASSFQQCIFSRGASACSPQYCFSVAGTVMHQHGYAASLSMHYAEHDTASCVQAAWRCAVDLEAVAHSEADAAVLTGVLLRRRSSAHPSTDICALATGVIKVHRSPATGHLTRGPMQA